MLHEKAAQFWIKMPVYQDYVANLQYLPNESDEPEADIPLAIPPLAHIEG